MTPKEKETVLAGLRDIINGFIGPDGVSDSSITITQTQLAALGEDAEELAEMENPESGCYKLDCPTIAQIVLGIEPKAKATSETSSNQDTEQKPKTVKPPKVVKTSEQTEGGETTSQPG